MKKTLLKTLCTVITLSLTTYSLNAQNVGINENGAAPSGDALLDIASASGTKGLLIPRVNIANLSNIAPITGGSTTSLLVYNTNNTTGQGYYYWNGSAWVKLSTGDAWQITGNNNTSFGTHFLGTTNAQGVDFRTNNTIRLRIPNANQIHANANGTAALPFYSWANDANTGMSRLAADQLNWSTGGAERLRLRNVQLATTFSGTAGVPAYSFTTDTDIGMYRSASNRLNFSTAGVERLELGPTEAVFNDASNNYDFRIESNNNANIFHVDAGNDVIGFSGTPTAPFFIGIPVHEMTHPFEIGNDGGAGTQATLGYWAGGDVEILPETDWYGYVGNSTYSWYRGYSYSWVNVSSSEKKREITPINGNESVENYVLNAIDNIQPYFYKYINEEDELNEENYTKYRPMMHIGALVEESPDFIKDEAFSGIDIYGLATLSLVGVKANREAIKQMKGTGATTIQDFGSENVTNSKITISYSEDFSGRLDGKIPVITVTTNNPNVIASVVNKSKTDFTVQLSGEINSNTYIDWIAMGKVDNINNTVVPSQIDEELKSKLEVSDAIKSRMKKLFSQPSTLTRYGK